jgi:ATP-dependent protease ClpP protease subunit
MKEIILAGVIGVDVFADDIRKQLPTGREQIRLAINSPGGDVFEAFEMYNLLKEYPGKVTARVTGLAASAAADLFFGADEREWFSHAAVMYHRAWTIAMGNARELQEEANILDSLDKIRIADFSRVTGKDAATSEAEFTDETWLVGDSQIRAAGIGGTLVDGELEVDQIDEPQARSRVAQTRAMLRRSAEQKAEMSRNKIAALLKTDTPAQAVVNKPQGGAIVNLEEFLAQNPGAEKEILAYAKTKIGPGADEAAVRKAESERIVKLYALAGVTTPEDVKQAVAAYTSPEAYAVSVLEKQREIEARLKTENNLNPGKVAQDFAAQAGVNPSAVADNATVENVKALALELGRR